MKSAFDRLDLNFAPRRNVTAAGWLLLLAGLLMIVPATGQLRAALVERADRAQELAQASAASAPRRSTTAQSLDPRAQKAALAVEHDLSVPWAALFANLERIRQGDVALLALEPSAARQEIRITAEARNARAMLDYVDALRGADFAQATLESHEFETQVPGNPIRFVLQAKWRSQ